MTRTVLCALLAGASILLGLATALVQAGNRDRGAQLNERMERCRMLEGVTRDSATAVLAQDWGVLPSDPTILERAKLPKPAQAQKPVAPKGAQP